MDNPFSSTVRINTITEKILKRTHFVLAMMGVFVLSKLFYASYAGASPRIFLWGEGVGFVKSWISYTKKYSDLSEGATKTK